MIVTGIVESRTAVGYPFEILIEGRLFTVECMNDLADHRCNQWCDPTLEGGSYVAMDQPDADDDSWDPEQNLYHFSYYREHASADGTPSGLVVLHDAVYERI